MKFLGLFSIAFFIVQLPFGISRQTEQQPKLVAQTGHTTEIRAVSISPDGRILATGDLQGSIKLWEVSSGKELGSLGHHGSTVNSLSFSPNNKLLASGGAEGDIRLWYLSGTEDPRTLSGHKGGVQSVTFSPDGKMLASGSDDHSLKLWDVTTGLELRTVLSDTSTVNSVTFSPDGRILASGSGDHTIRLLNPASGKLMRTLRRNPPPGFARDFSIAFGPDGKTLASGGCCDGAINLWNVASGLELRTFHWTSSTRGLAFSPDGKTLASGAWHGGQIVFWDPSTGKEIKTLRGHSIPSTVLLAFSVDGKSLVSSGSQDKTIKIWDVASGEEVRNLSSHSGYVNSVSLSADNKLLASGGKDEIKLWSLVDGGELRTLTGHSNRVEKVSFSSDGRMLASSDFNGTVKLWDVPTGRELRTLNGHSANVAALSFSPDRTILASGSLDETIKLWEVGSGRLLRSFNGHPAGGLSGIFSVSFSEDGQTLASGGNADNAIKLWDVASGKLLRTVGPDSSTITIKEIVERFPRLAEDFERITVSDKLIAGAIDASTILFDKTKAELARLIALDDDDWVVVSPDGRFDTTKLENPEGLHWILSDAPFRPLSFEVFMRDYYEPKLLPRLMKCTEEGNCDREFKPVRDLSSLNRTQPLVKITKVAPTASPESVEVSVEVNNVVSEFQKDAAGKQLSSGVFDLRLFRDGQLVGYSTSNEKLQTTFRAYQNFDDDLAVWRTANRVELVDGKRTFAFKVKLPANPPVTALSSSASLNSGTADSSAAPPVKEVEFSAYAFNKDRVKSNTATSRWALSNETSKSKAKPPRVKPRAYVISVGVNANENPAFDLQFAANDARRFQEVLSQRLTATNEYSEVVPVSLISDWEERGGQKVTTQRGATKANFKAVIDLLAGRRVSDEIKRDIPNAGKLLKSTPDDLVMILFSSHGYADRNGAFYFITYDTGPGTCKTFTETVRERSISSDELSLWLRDVDSGQMTLIVDACYSTAAIEGSGFKPGPMGSRGLGQLAYDKRMRILTATQADNVAMELTATADGRAIKHGLLSYALLENGLDAGGADFKPLDKNIFMAEWLEFGTVTVPKLFALIPKPAGAVLPIGLQAAAIGPARNARLVMQRELADTGTCGTANRTAQARPQEQQPALFDFTRRGRDVLITRKN